MAQGGVAKRKHTTVFGFYKRKLLFFVMLFGLVFGGFSYFRSNSFQADTEPILSEDNIAINEITVKLTQNGTILVNGQESKEKINLMSDGLELRLPVVDAPGIDYDSVQMILELPSAIANQTEHQVLAIHGVGESNSFVRDDSTIVYEVSDVSAFATISIVAKMPKGSLDLPLGLKISKVLSDLKLNAWLLIAVALPILTLIFMIALVLYQTKRQRIETPEVEINAPPMAIPPAVVGVLFNQKVRPREIAATLIDLAVRGDIAIIDRERGFSFGKGKFDQRLLGYEKLLLSKIFQKGLSSNQIEIERRINDHFYSRKISIVSAGIYALSTRLGYFKTNPQKIHAKYRLIGFFALTTSLAGFFLSLKVFTDPPYIVFFWIGMMLSSIIIIVSAVRIPIRSVLGQETLTNWIAFKKFLSNPAPLSFNYEISNTFERYLPYAIVLNCEAAWAKRFSNHNFYVPDWFLTEKMGLGIEDFCLALFPIISYVSRSLVALREPGFE